MNQPIISRNPALRFYQLIERGTGRVLDERDMRRDEATQRNCALLSEFYRARTNDPKRKLARWEIAREENETT